MEIGIHLPHIGPLATREGITAFAKLAEEYEFDSLWVSDHVVMPRKLSSRYPYSPDGNFPVPPDVPFLEPLSTLLFAAAVTERVKLGTTILVIPMRNPIVTAKQLASLDVLSGGRLIVGVGSGWMEEEFQMLGRRSHGEALVPTSTSSSSRRCGRRRTHPSKGSSGRSMR